MNGCLWFFSMIHTGNSCSLPLPFKSKFDDWPLVRKIQKVKSGKKEAREILFGLVFIIDIIYIGSILCIWLFWYAFYKISQSLWTANLSRFFKNAFYLPQEHPIGGGKQAASSMATGIWSEIFRRRHVSLWIFMEPLPTHIKKNISSGILILIFSWNFRHSDEKWLICETNCYHEQKFQLEFRDEVTWMPRI